MKWSRTNPLIAGILFTTLASVPGCRPSGARISTHVQFPGVKVAKYVDVLVDARTEVPKTDIDEPDDVAHLNQQLVSHKIWLERTRLSFFRNASKSALVVGGSDSINPELSLISKNNPSGAITEWTWKLLPGGKLSVFCDALARDIAKDNFDTYGTRGNLQGMNLDPDAGILPQDLDCIDMRLTWVSGQDMDGFSLWGADLRESTWNNASLKNADLRGADLRQATFLDVDLYQADLSGADLRGSRFIGKTDLRSVRAVGANFEGATLDPAEIGGMSIINATGLEAIKFFRPEIAIKLRSMAKDAGLHEEERGLISAGHKFEMVSSPRLTQLFDAYIAGGKLTDYGARPWKSIAAMLWLIPLFSLVYIIGLFRKQNAVIVLVSRIPDQQRAATWKALNKVRAATGLRRHLRIWRVAFYISLTTAFRIGWHDLNVGNWLAGMQLHDYKVLPQGWLRTVAGFQSLTSLYLLALWLVTMFSNPF